MAPLTSTASHWIDDLRHGVACANPFHDGVEEALEDGWVLSPSVKSPSTSTN